MTRRSIGQGCSMSLAARRKGWRAWARYVSQAAGRRSRRLERQRSHRITGWSGSAETAHQHDSRMERQRSHRITGWSGSDTRTGAPSSREIVPRCPLPPPQRDRRPPSPPRTREEPSPYDHTIPRRRRRRRLRLPPWPAWLSAPPFGPAGPCGFRVNTAVAAHAGQKAATAAMKAQ